MNDRLDSPHRRTLRAAGRPSIAAGTVAAVAAH
jgi:hypothetical protein